MIIVVVPPIAVAIDDDDGIYGVDDAGDVTEEGEKQAYAELQTAAAVAEEDAERGKDDGDEDLKEEAAPLRRHP